MNVLVLNAGSSSLKFQVFAFQGQEVEVILTGLIERIGETGSAVASHHDALLQVMQKLVDAGVSPQQLQAIGHRVVHGGETFTAPTRITKEVMDAIREMIRFAPLHNPANLEGIEVAHALFPSVPQVAVFDTAFHQTLPEYAFRYAVPEAWYRSYHVRRYGFHGTSHQYVAQQTALCMQRELDSLNLISLHLGNGCSACAIAAGRSVDTSMGMTPLEGLMMGTRCGDLDPALQFYVQRELGLSPEALETLLNKRSGLMGVCGSSDMREIHTLAEQGDQAAQLARAMFAYRIKKYIGAYLAVLGRVDALIFTGGIGEHAADMRALICDALTHLGIELDSARNSVATNGTHAIHSTRSPIAVWVIPTNEELAIARATLRAL